MSEIAWCSRCEMPLVCTFLIPYKEWYCVGCGRSWGWFSEPHTSRTPEREAEVERVQAMFEPVARRIITPRCRWTFCERCQSGEQGDHEDHATDEERSDSDAAWEELNAMRKVLT